METAELFAKLLENKVNLHTEVDQDGNALKIILCKEKNEHTYSVSRLVAKDFLKNCDNIVFQVTINDLLINLLSNINDH